MQVSKLNPAKQTLIKKYCAIKNRIGYRGENMQ